MKKCPFCGSTNISYSLLSEAMECDNCQACGPNSRSYGTPGEVAAMQLWDSMRGDSGEDLVHVILYGDIHELPAEQMMGVKAEDGDVEASTRVHIAALVRLYFTQRENYELFRSIAFPVDAEHDDV